MNRPVLDRATALCLACSSSLPPRKAISSSPSSIIGGDEIFITPCCGRPICPACLSANPRLSRYNPCLRCLGGMDAVNSRSLVSSKATSEPRYGYSAHTIKNVDGAVRDEDVFTLGDDDADDIDDEPEGIVTPPPPYEETSVPDCPLETLSSNPSGSRRSSASADHPALDSAEVAESSTPARYYIKPSDTLLGIALKFDVDAHAVCRLNGLPPSTIRTTPHLLHTRSFLTLPPSARNTNMVRGFNSQREDEEHVARRVRAHAELRFRALTKEDDPRVARAYVAIADLRDPLDDSEFKLNADHCDDASWKKIGPEPSAELETLEERAVDQYYDDDEWEQRERREGRQVVLPKFPLEDRPRVGQVVDPSRIAWWQWL
ncbi:hypothetical protein BKA93DRAFT_869572 [Sparassis latifolia]